MLDKNALIVIVFVIIVVAILFTSAENYKYYPIIPPNDLFLRQGPDWIYNYREGRGELLSSPLPQTSSSLSPLPREPLISAPTLYPANSGSFSNAFIDRGEGRGEI